MNSLPLAEGFKKSLVAAFYAAIYIVAYFCLVNYSKQSPLGESGVEGLTAIFCLFSIIFLVTSIIVVATKFFEIGILRFKPQLNWNLSFVAVFILLVTFNLLVIENFTYTLFGFGLKTNNSIIIKLCYFAVSIFLTTVLCSLCVNLLTTLSWRIAAFVLAGCGLFVVYHGYNTKDGLSGISNSLKTASLGKRPNVIILSTDGVESARMSVYGYARDTTPFLKSKQAEFTVFENAFTNNGNTTGSITSLLTGRLPISSQVVYPPDILKGDDSILTLPRILRMIGYYCVNWAVPYYADGKIQNLISAFDEEHGVVAISSFLDSWLPFRSGLEHWLIAKLLEDWGGVLLDGLDIRELDNPYDQIRQGSNTISDKHRLEGVLSAIDHNGAVFVNAHFMGTHGPKFIPVSHKFSSNKVQAATWDLDYHDDSIVDFDEMIHRVYQKLQYTGKLNNTILIVTSDHGILYSTSKRIPLLVRFPNNNIVTTPKKVNVQRIDVAPTILEYIGTKVPTWMDGKSLLYSEAISPDRPIVSTKIIAPKIDKNKMVMYHDDGKVFGSNHETRVIICDRYFLFLYPQKLVEKGKTLTTNPTCTIKEEEMETIARNELAMRLSAKYQPIH
jgi:hypothetical protein